MCDYNFGTGFEKYVKNTKPVVMKKLIFILLPAILFLNSCEYMPYASFSPSDDEVSTGELVYFDNFSDHAIAYEWDFGDGYLSTLTNPSHSYSNPGSYKVTLTAYGQDDNYDRAYLYINVTGGATLEVTVREWRENTYYGQLISNAEVTLYYSEEDFYNFEYPVISGYTGYDGKIIFEGLDPNTRYFIDVYNDKYNNELLYLDDVNFVRTDYLVSNAINTFTAYVDYNPSTNKSTDRVRSTVKSNKERVASAK